MLVFGNSTDYWPNLYADVGEPTDDAWPALLGGRLAADFGELNATVRNLSGKGAGHDLGFRGVSSMLRNIERAFERGVDRPVVVVIAPSIVDLQLKDLDVDASFEALLTIVALAEGEADGLLVAPMHPVGERQGIATAEAVADFNERLVATGLTRGYDRSPLLADDGLWARPDLYDDFDYEELETEGPDPDGIHPDTEGHVVIAEAIAPFVATAVADVCPT